MSNVVGERFQITIDKKVREELGVEPGDRAVERVEDGRLVVSFVPREHHESMLGILKRYVPGGIEPISDWQELKDQAWDARVAEVVETLGTPGRGRRRSATRRRS